MQVRGRRRGGQSECRGCMHLLCIIMNCSVNKELGREVGEQERWVGGLTVTNSSERHAKPAAVMGKEQRRTGGIL